MCLYARCDVEQGTAPVSKYLTYSIQILIMGVLKYFDYAKSLINLNKHICYYFRFSVVYHNAQIERATNVEDSRCQ